jgi:hypothetical protein
MTATDADGGDDGTYRTVGVDAPDVDGYAAVELDDGGLIVYDLDREERWVQSTDWIGLEFMR